MAREDFSLLTFTSFFYEEKFVPAFELTTEDGLTPMLCNARSSMDCDLDPSFYFEICPIFALVCFLRPLLTALMMTSCC